MSFYIKCIDDAHYPITAVSSIWGYIILWKCVLANVDISHIGNVNNSQDSGN